MIKNNFQNQAILHSLSGFEDRDLRETGIGIIGAVPWGTHFCQFYQTKRDILDILVPYFKKGLEGNEFCMWVTSEPLSVEDAIKAMKKAMPDFEEYLKKGQIEIIPFSKWYIKGGSFEENRVLKGWIRKLEKALAKGFAGLRLTGNTFWIEKKDWRAFAEYEEAVNNIIGKYKILAICSYSLEKCNAIEVIDIVSNHQFSIVKRLGKWTLIESSEHKKAKDALRTSEQRMSTILSSIGDGVIATDVSGKVTFMNAVAEKLTGWSIDKALQRPLKEIFNVINENTRRDVDCPVARALKKRVIVNLAKNTILIRKDKTEIPIEDSAAPIADQDNNITGVVLVFRDISHRKKAEEKILHLASFPGMTPNPVIEFTEKGEVIYSNPTANRLFPDLKKIGAKHPYIGEWQAIVLQVKKNRNNNLEREISVGGRVYMQTIQYVSSSGVFRIYAKDITYRKQVEEVLRKSEAKFRALYDANIIGVVLGDLKNNIFDANDAFLKIIGYTRKELQKGKLNCNKLTVKKYKERDERAVEQLLTKGVTTPWEKEYIKKDGSHVPVIIGKVLTNKDSEETIAFVLDNAERKKLERRKDEFIGTASHELKTPLTVIKAFSQILQKRFEKSKDKQNEYFARNIDDQVSRLTNLVNDLLDVSKIQAGKLKYNYEMFDVDALVRKTVVDFQYVTKTHQIERIGEAGRKLYGDEERIHQVLVNLISNAIKYSPNANKVIVRTENKNDAILVSVQDFGLGVSDSNKEKIFERFYTGREKEKKSIPGFGMGLYICKEIIKDHHGKLWVESKRGEGSTFYFTLLAQKKIENKKIKDPANSTDRQKYIVK